MTPTATVLRNRLLARARLRHLLVFVKTADLGSVRLAAEAVGIAQPSATQSLADLEALLEMPLFLRHSRGMSATAAGRTLLPTARRLLTLVDESATHLTALTARANSLVRVASISAAIPGLLARALPLFCRDHPEIVVQLIQADSAQQSTLLAAGEIDLAVCRQPETAPEGCRFISLLPDRFAIVCGPRHPLAGKPRVSMNELAQARWRVVPVSIAARRVFDELFAKASTLPATHNFVTALPETIWPMLNDEDLLTILPVSLVKRDLAAGRLVEVPFTLSMRIDDIGMLTSRAELGRAVETLSAFLVQFASHSSPQRAARGRK